MKKVVLLIVASMLCIALVGCQAPDPTHKDTLILVANIAENHLAFERDYAYLECEADNVPAEECKDAIDYERWRVAVSKFEQYINEAEDLEIGAEELDLIADMILEEMNGDVDPRVKMYIADIKAVLKMMLRDEETRMMMKARPLKLKK